MKTRYLPISAYASTVQKQDEHMTGDPQYLGQVLNEFFGSADIEHVHVRLHAMQSEIQLGRLALLPRAELAQRAALAEDLQQKIGALYQSIIGEYGDDPGQWGLPSQVLATMGDVFALYFANTAMDHSSASGVEPAGVGMRRLSGRGRSSR